MKGDMNIQMRRNNFLNVKMIDIVEDDFDMIAFIQCLRKKDSGVKKNSANGSDLS